MLLVSHLSELHSPWSVPVVSGPCKVHTLPSASDSVLMSPTSPWECWAAGWRGSWSCGCRRIPPSALEYLFLFEKILLLNPAAPYKEGPVLSHSPPLQLHWGQSGSESNMAHSQLSPAGAHSLCGFTNHFVLIPLPETSSNQVSLGAAQAFFGRGGSP